MRKYHISPNDEQPFGFHVQIIVLPLDLNHAEQQTVFSSLETSVKFWSVTPEPG